VTKVRYFRLKIPLLLSELIAKCLSWRTEDGRVLQVIRHGEREVVFCLTTIRYLTVTEFGDGGSTIKRRVPTMEQHTFRVFFGVENMYVSILNPTRGSRAVDVFFEEISGSSPYFLEPLEITQGLIDRHIGHFASSRLVSAKIKDFKVFDDAVGRLEVTSKNGLPPEIAPFLKGKFHRVDALTYEVTYNYVNGLVWYSSAGTVRVSGPLVEVAFPFFEANL
jgi:hypothetical protein